MALLSSSSPLGVRVAVFLLGCVLVRVAIVVVAARVALDWLPLLGLAAAVGGIGLIRAYALNTDAPGAVFGSRPWWNGLRPVHGALYLAFAVLAVARVRLAWTVLAADVALGVAAFVAHYGLGVL